MNKLNVVIIEDEVPAARLLNSMVMRLRPEWNVTVLPGSVDEAVLWFREHPHPDIIFLDIQLADGNSFDFLSVAKPTSVVIFTTAYDQYAVRAFAVNSIDYILKPVDEKRLSDAILKYETLLGGEYVKSQDYLETLLDALQQKEKRYRSRFLISGVDRFWTLRVDDIAYFYSENKVTFAVTKNGQEHIIDLSLNKLTDQLDPACFFRANRQIIVCIDAIDHAEPYFNGKIVVTVRPPYKTKVTISEEKLSAFKLWLNF
ncbi:LytTR family DNA-binding domain-containing protein [Parabacteroides sp. AF17-28]|uniref:LytR/AlgR family response regulator transcription factor n=1 Tax=Parabacteroides sp. AF17-28 TaxID=2292241 RepID=UPI000EFF26F2|nr:LytTR family DNA-binding domain-containing protein [Parabacteroides sp. AF17-28]RHR53335.1 DNA-binding response regulator [Parabacteroides sp. AF17-28]